MCFGGFWCSFCIVCFCWRNDQREAVGAERMRLSQDKGRSGMIMRVRESWAYPNRQYGFPACSLRSVTSNTRTHTHRSLTDSSFIGISAVCLWVCVIGRSAGLICGLLDLWMLFNFSHQLSSFLPLYWFRYYNITLYHYNSVQ